MIFFCIEFECESFCVQAWLLSNHYALIFFYSLHWCFVEVLVVSCQWYYTSEMVICKLLIVIETFEHFYWNWHLVAPSFLPKFWNHYIHALLMSELFSACVIPKCAVLLGKYSTTVEILLVSFCILIILILLVSVPLFLKAWLTWSQFCVV